MCKWDVVNHLEMVAQNAREMLERNGKDWAYIPETNEFCR